MPSIELAPRGPAREEMELAKKFALTDRASQKQVVGLWSRPL